MLHALYGPFRRIHHKDGPPNKFAEKEEDEILHMWKSMIVIWVSRTCYSLDWNIIIWLGTIHPSIYTSMFFVARCHLTMSWEMIDATLQAYMGTFFSTTIIKNKPADLAMLATTGLFGVIATTGLFGTKCPKSRTQKFFRKIGSVHFSSISVPNHCAKFQKNS